MNYLKKLLFVIFIFFMFWLPEASLACVGARPMGMGGAFIAVADDVNTIYWNPAGLTLLKETQLTYTRTINHRDNINYDDYFGFADTSPDHPIGYALGYIGVRQYGIIGYINPWTPVYLEYKKPMIYGSLGYQINNNFSLGGSLRGSTITYNLTAPGYYPERDSSSGMEIDVSALFRSETGLSLGLLIQNINAPLYRLFDGDIQLKMIRNIRGGLSYRLNEILIVAVDRYDFWNEANLHNPYMFGLETNLYNFSIRGGYYLGTFKTLGWGYSTELFNINHTLLIGEEITHLIGTVIRF